MEKNKLNVGCGLDYREGFVNIDGSDVLEKVDKRIDVSQESLLDHFPSETIKAIVARDIIEHQFRWEDVRLLNEFYELLVPGGKLEMRMPDAEYIIKSWKMPLKKKLTLLFGGQDVPQYQGNVMDQSRKRWPQFFCHKYGWTQDSMRHELKIIGFSNIICRRKGANFTTHATK